VMLRRLALNLFAGWFRLSRWFPRATMARIRDAIAEGERRHVGELCFAVESRYSPWDVLAGLQPRRRAEQAFALLRVWDTEHNSGVLLYLQLAERRVEIVADRGVHAKVGTQEWQAICRTMEAAFGRRAYREGALSGIRAVARHLRSHYPATKASGDPPPAAPVLL